MSSHTRKVQAKAMRLYKSGLSCERVSEATGVPAGTVHMWAEKRGINRSYSQAQKQNSIHNRSDRICCLRMYEAGLPMRQVADETGVPFGTVRRWIQQAGIVRSRSEAQKARRDREYDQQKLVRIAYMRLEGATMAEIADEIDVSRNSVSRRLKTRFVKRLMGAQQ